MACFRYGSITWPGPYERPLANGLPSYDLPHRVHTSKSYPLHSPNGSTIIVYGHEQGLRVVWKGGRLFKRLSMPLGKKPKSNGASEDAIMIVDSDEEAAESPDQPLYQDNSHFEEDDNEFDVSEPYESVVQTLDLLLGVEVLHLAFPHLPAVTQTSALESLPILFSQKLVLAVACSDFSVRVILIPLLPTSPRIKNRNDLRNTANLGAGKSVFGEQMIILSSGTTHRSIPKGVSISMTSSPPEDLEDINMEEPDAIDKKMDLERNLSRSASRSRSRSRLRDHQWDLLIASHSADLSGLLLIHRIPILAGEAGLCSETHILWRTQYLASPTVSVYFNSALYPASRHSQLLIVETKGVVRILDCIPQSKAAEGSWRLSLYTDFETLQDTTSRRKRVLDAQWVLGGRAILALLADGKWGVWDLESARPKPTDGVNPSRSTSKKSLTTFALEGWVGDSLKTRKLLKSSSTKTENTRSKLAPMTPGARKIRQQAFFTEPTPQPDGPVRGGLSVSPVQDTSNSRADDDAVLAWYENTIAIIPSLFIHWQNKARGSGNLFGSGAKGEPKLINNIQLGGESCKEASLMPSHHRSGSAKDDATHPDILVTGDHRLIIVTSPIAEPRMNFSPPSPLLSSTTDQQLLTKGDLDVGGMDRILAGLSDSQTTPTRTSGSLSHTKGNNLLML